MALHEKKLPFESHIINLIKGQQYEPWFLQLNPKGEVPVLQDTGKIIPDSTRIIDYLEDNFSNGMKCEHSTNFVTVCYTLLKRRYSKANSSGSGIGDQAKSNEL